MTTLKQMRCLISFRAHYLSHSLTHNLTLAHGHSLPHSLSHTHSISLSHTHSHSFRFSLSPTSYTGHMRFIGEIYMYGLVGISKMKGCVEELMESEEVMIRLPFPSLSAYFFSVFVSLSLSLSLSLSNSLTHTHAFCTFASHHFSLTNFLSQ